MRGAVPRLMRPGMRSDREEPVLDRLRGVMRVGCSGAKSEESSRWRRRLVERGPRRRERLLIVSNLACRAEGRARVRAVCCWLWFITELGEAAAARAARVAVVIAISILTRESSSQFLPPPVIPEMRRPRLKLYTGETTTRQLHECVRNEASRQAIPAS